MSASDGFSMSVRDFFVGGLAHSKRVKILLPEGSGPFPLLIVHDGKCAFRKDAPEGCECLAIDEALAGLGRRMAVAAIEEEPWQTRTKEYSPFPWVDEASVYLPAGEEKGKAYAEWIMKGLLPALESDFPIERNGKGRYMLGCSLGALMSAYMSFAYPGAFGKIGCMSLASWGNEPAFLSFCESRESRSSYFLRVGTNEGTPRGIASLSGAYPRIAEDFRRILIGKGRPVDFAINDGRAHKTVEWSKDMPAFVGFLSP
ncbi:MAG: alpha/beta hydrolase-fold protein [Bacilli bacterium]|jgi:predicted alpha/beta superfamily hydrolase|nr:alpha/beta hydrolase-fold protein [Bacilli bacterium]